jgi:hypothetical protein
MELGQFDELILLMSFLLHCTLQEFMGLGNDNLQDHNDQ